MPESCVTVMANSPEYDRDLAERCECEMPGFWEFFYERNPKFARLKTPAGPVGWLPMGEVYEAIGETITAYLRDYRDKAFAERTLANVRPEIHDEVAYALDLAATENQ